MTSLEEEIKDLKKEIAGYRVSFGAATTEREKQMYANLIVSTRATLNISLADRQQAQAGGGQGHQQIASAFGEITPSSHQVDDQLLNRILEMSFQQETRFNELSQGLMLSINEIKSNVKVTNYNLTPSKDCESSAESSFLLVMETLRLPYTMNLLSLVHTVEDDAGYPLEEFTFEWEGQFENAAYNPILQYLKKVCASERAVDISQGKNLPSRHFFNTAVFSLRTKVGVSSADLRPMGAEPRLKYQITGTSDIAVLRSEDCNISRVECRYCIEVKRVQDMKTNSLTNKALREGVLQLIGLNAHNDYVSPPVIVTNLNKKHFLLFISKDEGDTISFKLNIHRYNSFAKVVLDAQSQSCKPCVTQLFGSPPTPMPSENGNGSDDDDDEECKVQVHQVDYDDDDVF